METTAPHNAIYANATKLVPNGQQVASQQSNFSSFLFGKNGLGLDDVIDTINPLHHIPVISTFYENFTGDEIANLPALIGGAITGGPMGVASAVLNIASKETTDKNIGSHIFDMFSSDETHDNDALHNTFAHATKLSADNGAAALSLFESGELEASAIVAAQSLTTIPNATTEPKEFQSKSIADITHLYSLKQSRMGISAPLADIKA